MSKYCANCGTVHEERLNVCIRCGRILTELPAAVTLKTETPAEPVPVQKKRKTPGMTANENDPKGFIFNIVLAVLMLFSANMMIWLAVFSMVTGSIWMGIGLLVPCTYLAVNGVFLLKKRWSGVVMTKVRYCLQLVLWLAMLITGIVKGEAQVYLSAGCILVLQIVMMVVVGKYYQKRILWMK